MTESESPKSPLPHTSTLVIIALVLLICGSMLSVWLPYHRNQVAIAEFRKLDGTALSVIVRPFWIPDAIDDEYLWVFERVDTIEFSDIRISDAGLRHLQGLNSLSLLTLDNTHVSDAGLHNLQELTNLETLYLNYTQVSDVGLECLRELSKLEHLALDNTQVTKAGIDKLKKALPHCKITWTPRIQLTPNYEHK